MKCLSASAGQRKCTGYCPSCGGSAMPNLLRFSIVSTGSAWQRYIEVDESRTDQAEMTSSLKVLLMATADWVCIVSAGVAEASTRLFPPADSTATEQHSSNVTPHHWEGCLAASPRLGPSLLRFGAEPSPARAPLSTASHAALLHEERLAVSLSLMSWKSLCIRISACFLRRHISEG